MGLNGYDFVLEAAAAGQGIALGWRAFIVRHLATGALVALADGFDGKKEAVAELLSARFAAEPTVADLMMRFLEEHVEVHCKPRTGILTRRAIRNHILAEFGKVPLAAVEAERVSALHRRPQAVYEHSSGNAVHAGLRRHAA